MNRILTAMLAAAIAIMLVASAWAEDKTATQSEAQLSAAEAEAALKPVLPDVKVLSVERAVTGDLWEIAFTSRGDKGIVYLDSSRKHILVGSLIRLEDGANFTKKKFETISSVDFSSIPLEGSLVIGKKDAPFKVVVFDDPD